MIIFRRNDKFCAGTTSAERLMYCVVTGLAGIADGDIPRGLFERADIMSEAHFTLTFYSKA